jgi:prefoldin alpha subunit
MAEEGEDVNQALARLDAYRRQMELVGRNLSLLEALWTEAARARTTLEAWKDQPQDAETLVPLGSNTFVHAKVGAADHVILGIGRGYATQRPVTDAIASLAAREKDLRKQADAMGQAALDLQAEAAQLQAAIEDAMAGAREPGPPRRNP